MAPPRVRFLTRVYHPNIGPSPTMLFRAKQADPTDCAYIMQTNSVESASTY